MQPIERHLSRVIGPLRRGYPAIAITGPRQSGKTTLARMACTDLPYVNLESPAERELFRTDPVGFLAGFPNGAILDEVQNVPEASSYLQVRIDADGRMGRWVLTGSRQPELSHDIGQSLAGRVGLLHLLPFSHAELANAPNRPTTLADAVLRGGYPPLYDADRELEPARWLEDYVETFVSRDIRPVLSVRDRGAFDAFLRLCAARSGQQFIAAAIAREIGLDGKTVSHWLSVLEACFVVRLVRPHFRNFGKRLVKAPKLFVTDSGLACRLLHITDATQLRSHPLYGALVESWCFGEVLKARLNRGLAPDLWYWRTSDGHEIDLVLESGHHLLPIEIKAAATPFPKHGAELVLLRRLAAERDPDTVVPPGLILYGGDEPRPCGLDRFVPWHSIDAAVAELDGPGST